MKGVDCSKAAYDDFRVSGLGELVFHKNLAFLEAQSLAFRV